MQRPQTTTEARALIGSVQYYREMWRQRSHILAPPLMEVSSGPKNKKLQWNQELEDPFIELKQMLSKETLLNYPDKSKPFDIHTDASDKQLGAVIS